MDYEITYKEINRWARSFEIRYDYYRRVHPVYKVLAITINGRGEKNLFLYDSSLKRLAWRLGTFKGHNSKELFENLILAINKEGPWAELSDYFLGLFDGYNLPVETKKGSKSKKKDEIEPKEIKDKIFSTPVEAKPSVDNSDVPPFETVVAHNDEEGKPQIETAEPETIEQEYKADKEVTREKEKDDHTYIDYNSFVFAKNGYIREKVNSFLFKYKVGVIALYTIIAIIISTSFFKSQYFLEASFIMRLLWIFVFIGVSVWLGKLADKKLSEMFDKFKKEEEDSFSLTDEVVYNKILDKMVNNEVDYFSHNTKRTLTRLLEKQSPDIPEEVYELKRSCDVSSATFVDAISTKNRNALLKQILDKQANFAREKSINLLNKIKEGGADDLAKEAITPLGRVDAAVRDILQKNNLVEEKDK